MQTSVWLPPLPHPQVHTSADVLATHTGLWMHTQVLECICRGEQTGAPLHTHVALFGLGVAGSGQSHMAKPHDSWRRSEGCILTGWPGKHSSTPRMDLNFGEQRNLSTCLGLLLGLTRLSSLPSSHGRLRALSPEPRDHCWGPSWSDQLECDAGSHLRSCALGISSSGFCRSLSAHAAPCCGLVGKVPPYPCPSCAHPYPLGIRTSPGHASSESGVLKEIGRFLQEHAAA